MRRQQKADDPQDDGADGHGQHRLRGNVIHQILAAGTHVLGTEGSAGHGETRAERNDEERDREADRHAATAEAPSRPSQKASVSW